MKGVLSTVRDTVQNGGGDISRQESNHNLNETIDKNTSNIGMLGRQQNTQTGNRADLIDIDDPHRLRNNSKNSQNNTNNVSIPLGLMVIPSSEPKEQEMLSSSYSKKPSWWQDQSEKPIDYNSPSTSSKSSFEKRFLHMKWYGFIHTVSCALTTLKSSLRFIRIDYATQDQLEAINDSSYYQSEWTKSLQREKAETRKKQLGKNHGFTQNKCLRRLKKNTREIRKTCRELKLKLLEGIQTCGLIIPAMLKHLPVLDPLSQLVLYWEYMYFTVSLMLFMYLPYSVSFETSKMQNGSATVLIPNYSIQWWFLASFVIIDIIKNCLTASYTKGEIIREPIRIIKQYIKTLEMPLDIFTGLTILGFVQFSYSQAVFCARFFYKPSLIQKFKDALSMSETFIAVIDLLNLFATIVFLGHIVASIWHIVGQLEADNKNEGWIVKYNFVDDSTTSLYINSYFFAIINMSSVKGTILPSTNTEKIICMILPFGACVLYGYTITSITIILRNINTKRDNFNMLMSKINKYMRRYNVDPTYQTRARKYVEYMKDSSLEERKTSRNVLNCLSQTLKDDIFINIFQQSLKKQPFIQKNFSKTCIEMLALKMTSQFFASNETIIDINVIAEPSLFIVIDGQVEEFLYPNKQTDQSEKTIDIRIKKKGDIVNEFEFFTHSLRSNSSVRSIGVSELHILKYKDFIEVLDKCEEDKENYANLRDQLIFNRTLSHLNIECIFCNERDHVERDCPQTFYECRRVAMARKFGAAGQKSTVELKRTIKQKRKGTKHQSLMQNKRIQEQAKCYLEDYSQEIEEDGFGENEEFQENQYFDQIDEMKDIRNSNVSISNHQGFNEDKQYFNQEYQQNRLNDKSINHCESNNCLHVTQYGMLTMNQQSHKQLSQRDMVSQTDAYASYTGSPPCPGQELDNLQQPFQLPQQTSFKPKPQFQEYFSTNQYLMQFCNSNMNSEGNNNNNNLINESNQKKKQRKTGSPQMRSPEGVGVSLNGSVMVNTPVKQQQNVSFLLANKQKKEKEGDEEEIEVEGESFEETEVDEEDNNEMQMDCESKCQEDRGSLGFIPNNNNNIKASKSYTYTNPIQNDNKQSSKLSASQKIYHNNQTMDNQQHPQNLNYSHDPNMLSTASMNYLDKHTKSSLRGKSNTNLNTFDLNSEKSMKSNASRSKKFIQHSNNNSIKQRKSIVSVNFALPQQQLSQTAVQPNVLDENGLISFSKQQIAVNMNNENLLLSRQLTPKSLKHESVDYSKLMEYKVYFPHNNFSNIIRPKDDKTMMCKRKQTIINILLKKPEKQ